MNKINKILKQVDEYANQYSFGVYRKDETLKELSKLRAMIEDAVRVPDGLEFEYKTFETKYSSHRAFKEAGMYNWGNSYTDSIYAYRLTGRVLEGWKL